LIDDSAAPDSFFLRSSENGIGLPDAFSNSRSFRRIKYILGLLGSMLMNRYRASGDRKSIASSTFES